MGYLDGTKRRIFFVWTRSAGDFCCPNIMLKKINVWARSAGEFLRPNVILWARSARETKHGGINSFRFTRCLYLDIMYIYIYIQKYTPPFTRNLQIEWGYSRKIFVWARSAGDFFSTKLLRKMARSAGENNKKSIWAYLADSL